MRGRWHEDRNYALAYAGLADAYAFLGIYAATLRPLKVGAKRKRPRAKPSPSMKTSPKLTLHSVQVHVLFAPSDFSLGDQELRRAIELSPSLALAHLYLGISLERQGRLDESLAENLKARELDPLSSVIARTSGSMPYSPRSEIIARALELLRQADEARPISSPPPGK